MFVPIGHLKDNIGLTLPNSAIYQAIILILAVLITPFLPRFIKKLVHGILNLSSIRFLAIVAIFIFVTANLISYFVLEHFPRDVDNVSRLFQARTFASGRLYVESPSAPEAFSVSNVVTKDGKMYSKYAPGSAIVYALWQRVFGIQWGVNPFLGGVMLILLYFIFRKWYSEQTVRLVLILLCLSPFFVFMTSSFHSHLPCLFFLTAFLLFLVLGHENRKWYYFMLSGIGLGMAFITRSYTALLVSFPFLIWHAVLNRPRTLIRQLPFFTMGFALPLCFLLYYNNALTGHPLRFPFLVANPDEKIGFGYMGHTPLKGMKNTAEMLRILWLKTLGLPFSLSFLILFIFLGKKRRWDYVLLASILCLIIGHFFYYWTDFSFGPRFYFEILPFLIMLSARGMIHFPEYMRRIGFRKISHDRFKNFIYCFVILSFLFSFIFYIPPLIRMYHHDYNEIVNTKVGSLASKSGITHGLVFIKKIEGYNAYASGFLANTLDFSGDIVYAQDRGEEQNKAVIMAYPGRDVFLFEFDRITRQGKFIDYSNEP